MSSYVNVWFKCIKNELLSRKDDDSNTVNSAQYGVERFKGQLTTIFNALKSGVIFILCLYCLLFVTAGFLAIEGDVSFYAECSRILNIEMTVAILLLGCIAAVISWLGHVWSYPNRRRK